MNVYDFDETIYHGDSTRDFYFFCLKNYPKVAKHLPMQGWYGLQFGLKIMPKTQFKEKFYGFLKSIPDIDGAVAEFWRTHEKNLKKWYLDQKREDDLIISASPEFLLKPICGKLGIRVIASRVDKFSGKTDGENCWGEEKVKRFYAAGGGEIDEFYSDSYSDTPLALLAEKSFLVKGNVLTDFGRNKFSSK
ncbi:MAG: haloacid dehalogenase-like hydrolase [Clostridia bacterium]|nr:haloacid dehalogenase-like hydrolase [Clostridia bacterium]